MLRIRIRDPVLFCPLDHGYGISLSGSRIQPIFLRALPHFEFQKILKLFVKDSNLFLYLFKTFGIVKLNWTFYLKFFRPLFFVEYGI